MDKDLVRYGMFFNKTIRLRRKLKMRKEIFVFCILFRMDIDSVLRPFDEERRYLRK